MILATVNPETGIQKIAFHPPVGPSRIVTRLHDGTLQIERVVLVRGQDGDPEISSIPETEDMGITVDMFDRWFLLWHTGSAAHRDPHPTAC